MYTTTHMSTNKKAKIILGIVILIILIIGGNMLFQKNKESLYESLLNSGQLYADDHQYDKSVVDFRKAVELYPDRYQAYGTLAVALVFAGINTTDSVVAEEYYRESVDLIDKYLAASSEDDPDAWIHRGMAYFQLKDYEQAKINFEHAYTANPSDLVAKGLLDNAEAQIKLNQ